MLFKTFFNAAFFFTLIFTGTLLAVDAELPEKRVEFTRDFAPSEGWVKKPESQFRTEMCLNGTWQFQAVPIPAGYEWNKGTPPEMAPPKEDAWDKTPIKIPSPWNVNTWGNGRNVGAGTPHPYWPDSVYYPSYPESWDHVQMAWMRRTFTPTDEFFCLRGAQAPAEKPLRFFPLRVLLHFEAVSGMAEVYLNGKKVGENFGRFLPFTLDVTDAIKVGEENEILVGVRSLRLYDKISEKFPKMRTPYPPGSNMDNLNGIWQDVYLLAVPAVRVEDVFVKSCVSRDVLEVEVTLRNDTAKDARVTLSGDVFLWINEAGTDILDAPEPRWRLGENAAMTLKSDDVIAVLAGKTATVTFSEKVAGRMKPWSMDTPNLYGLVLDAYSPDVFYDFGGQKIWNRDETQDGMKTYSDKVQKCDTKYTRFGWREFKIVGKNLELNGEQVTLLGDLLHPFGPFISSRRYVWSWYTMVKEMHGNAVRPHAQPHPRIYAEMADEMGIAVLAETAMFGSSIQLNFEEPAAWQRYAEHYKRLILRDRNHPSVFGWSWGNELFAIFIYDKNITPAMTDAWYAKLAEYGRAGMKYDPTRNWYSCDGDEDVRGTMPVWNKHFGHGLPPAGAIPENLDKPLMIGEQGGTYYARPGQLAVFNGDAAYRDYRGRSEALAIDVYQNIVQVALPKLAFFSPAETAWFGLEHLPYGYRDFTRLPTKNDGVFFTKPFQENTPGVQPERLPPYVATLNPGWDTDLPLMRPLPLFEAQKAAQDLRGPQPCAWDRIPPKDAEVKTAALPEVPPVTQVCFLGDPNGELFARLTAIGVPLVPFKPEMAADDAAPQAMIIVDGNTYAGTKQEEDVFSKTRNYDFTVTTLTDKTKKLSAVTRKVEYSNKNPRSAIIIFREAGDNPHLMKYHLYNTKVVARTATQLTHTADNNALTDNLSADELYFAEESGDRHAIKCTLETGGKLEAAKKDLLTAATVDWSLFNESPEAAKCAAVCLYENLEKPSGAALACIEYNRCHPFYVTTIDVIPESPKNVALWKTLLGRVGVQFVPPPAEWLVKNAERGQPGAQWKYTTAKPAENWMTTEFDDAKWQTGPAGFGTGVPGVEESATRWDSDDIWLRTTFESDAATPFSELFLSVYHDEEVTIYLNGEKVLHRTGHISEYRRFPLGTPDKKLRKGKNTLAVHCLQTAGGQFIDVGLGISSGKKTAERKEHNLLMDGPPAE